MNKKITQRLLLFCVIVGSVVLTCLFLLISGTANPSISSFAVDSHDRLYVGKQSKIDVYKNGLYQYSINPRTSRAYVFTINENDNIILSTASKIYVLSLEGDEISSSEDPGANMYNQIQYQKSKFISQNADVYKLVGVLGWTRIIKNETTVVYQIDILSFTVKVLLIVSFLTLFIFLFYMLNLRLKVELKSSTGDGFA